MSKINEAKPELPLNKELKTIPKDGGDKWNRLVFEKSPYLLQHADNPVDWYPWGEEAFEIAQKENKPVFLSVGYSTCHWCHVMAHESFEDREVAELLKQNFICIKVDREDRPDIDNIYMTITQALVGRGGWPMSVFMTPQRKVFYAGTYFPKDQKGQMPGMMQLIPALAEAWQKKQPELESSAENIMKSIQTSLDNSKQIPGSNSKIELPELCAKEIINKYTLDTAFKQLLNQYDPEHGGFGQAPKFPCPHTFSFLMRYYKRSQDKKVLAILENSLEKIRAGGIYDHIGYGFHRYSTDREWLLPHFEKMLYDQAMHMIAYTEAYQLTNNSSYLQVVEEIFTYITRDMQDPEGGFYSAEDADSEGEEGKFYVWTEEEIKKILGKDDGEKFCKLFNSSPEGNFLDEATHRKTGKNIPHLKKPLDKGEINFVQSCRETLYEEREKRIHPLKDDKILTDWNGLMIAALSKAAKAMPTNPSAKNFKDLDSNKYLNAAVNATEFILTKLKSPEGRLLKRYREGNTTDTQFLNDYAFFIWGLLELYEACFEIKYLEEAYKLTNTMIELFWDDKQGGFYLTEATSSELPIRSKEIHDGAVPSGNSIAVLALAKLAHITGDNSYINKAELTIEYFANQIDSYPAGYTQMLSAIDFMIGPSSEIVIVGDPNSEDTKQMVQNSREGFKPNKVAIFKPSQIANSSNNIEIMEIHKSLEHLAPYTKDHKLTNNQATAYICENQTCKEPTNNPSALKDH